MGFGAGLKFHFRRWFGSDGLEGFRFRISFFFSPDSDTRVEIGGYFLAVGYTMSQAGTPFVFLLGKHRHL